MDILHKYIKALLVIVFACFIQAVMACPPPPPTSPVAILQANPSSIFLGDSVVLDGSDSHPCSGSIDRCEWDWDYNGITFTPDYNETPGDKKAEHIYDANGIHIVALKVRNTFGLYSNIATCTINVVVRVHNLNKDKWYGYIQRAVDDANNGNVIKVNEGVYSENIDFLGKKITLKSTEPNNWDIVKSTIICANEPNKTTVIFNNSEDVNTVIAGFRMVSGLRGVECNGTSPVIRNCIIAENGQANKLGGGVYNCNSATPIITNCFIVDNEANYGAGIYNVVSNAIVRDCVISRNIAGKDGGGIYNANCSPNIINCTITDNDANNGGGMCCYGSTAKSEMKNCIFWDNDANKQGNEVFNYSSAEPNFSYCDIKDSNGSGANWWDIIGHDNGGNIDTDPCFVPPNNAVSHWRFDEGSKNVVHDSASNNQGAVYGATWATGQISGALSFDGSNDHVGVPDIDNSLDMDNHMTISAWIKPNNISNYYCIVAKQPSGAAGNNYPGNYEFRIIQTTGFLQILHQTGTGNQYTSYISTSAVTAGEWQHVAVTLEEGNSVRFYINGEPAGILSQTATFGIVNNNPLRIGSRKDSAYWFNGAIDDVYIFNRALSSQEIQQLYEYSFNFVDNYKCHLNSNSPCINAGDPNFLYDNEVDIDNNPGVRLCRIDIGADEVNIPDTLDSDNDDLTNAEECENGTDPLNNDTDNDGMPDGWEVEHGLNPLFNDDSNDLDLDTYSNIVEYLHSSDPNDDSNLPQAATIMVPEDVNGIQNAIGLSINGDEIVVSEGTYYERINFLDRSITIRSADPNAPNVVTATIINADSISLDVVTFNNVGANGSVLNGFAIKNGRYGVYCSGSSPKIINCKISDNSSYGIRNNYSNSEIRNCTVTNNGSSGIYCFGNAPIIMNCKIENNISGGSAGIYCDMSSPLIQGCTIINCQYGISTSSYYGPARPTIRNCIIAKNGLLGMAINPDVNEITNCTIFDNFSGGIASNNNYSKIRNCIIWNNHGDGDLYHCSATYSCIKDVKSGQGNIHIDPMFINTVSNDFHLWYSSPCVNAGDPCSSYINEPDYPRGHIDMGAYGNTSEATGIIDDDNDGIADQWELLYWPNDDPNQHDANENLDGDKFNNLVEYMFRYNPTEETNVPITIVRVVLSTNKFDPTKNETVTVEYMLNMDANVVIKFMDSDDSANVAKTIQHSAAAGVTQTAIWDGKDSNGLIFEKKYYDVSISADDGDGNTATYNPGTVQLYYDHGITDLVCNPRRVIATYNEFATISYNIACDANVIVSVYDPCGMLFSVLLDDVSQQYSQNPQQIIWSPRQGEPNDPNSKYVSKEGFYEVEVKFPGMREKAKHKLAVYR